MIKTQNVIQSVLPNTLGTDYFVGDIHGRYNLLKREMEKVKFDVSVDRLFSVGDIIDRGTKNKECLHLLDEPWFFPVMGNHEDLAFEAVVNGCKVSESVWFNNGGMWWFNAHPEEKQELIPYITKLGSLPHIIVVDHVAVAHAELFYDIADYYGNLRITKLEQIKWGRTRVNTGREDFVKGVELVVVGHTPVSFPTVYGNTVYIDNTNNPLQLHTLKSLREIWKQHVN